MMRRDMVMKNHDPHRARRKLSRIAFAITLCVSLCAAATAQTKNSCLDCHARLEGALRIAPESVQSDIHAQKGITCVTCHGGDASSDDKARSMSPAAGYRGKVDKKQIPDLCGNCHSDAAYMRSFNPSLRTDQLSEYKTSVHGQKLAKGDTEVAVCTDCHGAHEILSNKDPRSRVYPANVAKTCAGCHANADYMKEYGISTTQFADYSDSVHYQALVVRGDLSAPTCSTCHGGHGATPPAVSSVANVCSTCHVIQGQLFAEGPHQKAFESLGLRSCVTCHTNHKIQHPTDAMIGTAEGAVCVNCHMEGDTGYDPSNQLHQKLTDLDAAIRRSDQILTRADQSGMEVGEAKLQLAEARDDLTKARVEIHTVTLARVEPDIQAGMAVAEDTYASGRAALAERSFRRKGLLLSVGTILIAMIGLWLKIREIESDEESGSTEERE